MPGVDWQEELARQIQQLAAVVVIWTPLSSASKNVRDEARLGQHTEKLVNAMFGVAEPPFPFDRTNGLPLDGWTGREPHRGWTRLVQTIEDRLVAAGVAKPGQLMAAQAAREASVRAGGERIAAAEQEFQAAKVGEESAADAVTAAGAGAGDRRGAAAAGRGAARQRAGAARLAGRCRGGARGVGRRERAEGGRGGGDGGGVAWADARQGRAGTDVRPRAIGDPAARRARPQRRCTQSRCTRSRCPPCAGAGRRGRRPSSGARAPRTGCAAGGCGCG